MRCVRWWGLGLGLACSSSGGPAAVPDGSVIAGKVDAGAAGTPGEEGTGDPPGPGRPLPGQKRAFVTASRYIADLRSMSRAASGLAGGDALCQISAEAGHLGGTWKAWLSAGEPGPTGTATHAVDRITGSGPWYRLDGEKVFNNKANLMTAPLVPLDRDENGRRVLADHEVWTGTEVGGRWTGQDCDQWTFAFNSKTGTCGDLEAADQKWTNSAVSNDCGASRRLYCLEQ